MPEDSAMRSRRYRAHRRGDHSLCGPKCRAAVVSRAVAGELPALGGVTEAVVEFADGLLPHWPSSDPRRISLSAAYRLAVMVDAGDAPVAAVRSLQDIVAWLALQPNEAANPVDELRARRHARVVAALAGLTAEPPA